MVDAILFVLAFYAGAYLYFAAGSGSFDSYLTQVPLRATLFAGVNVLCLAAMGLYEPRMREGASGVLLRTVGGFIAGGMVMAAIFYVLPELHLWRGIYFYAAVAAFTFSMINRSAFNALTHRDSLKSRVLVYGSGDAASTITSSMRRKADRKGFTIVGFVRVDGEEPKITGNERVINLRQPLAEYTRQTKIDQLIIALDDNRENLPIDELFNCRLNGVEVFDLVTFFEREAGKILVDFATPGWMTFTEGFKRSSGSRLAKRCFDVAASLMLLAFAWPFMLLTALAIWLEDGFGAPILFRQ
jgi:FlaA1/EpsC-like NDP-sugar epimerase